MTDAERTELESVLEIVYGPDTSGIESRVAGYAFNEEVQRLASGPPAALVALVVETMEAQMPRYTRAAALMRLYAAIRFALERDAVVTQ